VGFWFEEFSWQNPWNFDFGGKDVQGHIWRVGYEQGELHGEFFDDVPEALAAWHASGNKTYIYSSGSREAQRLIFGNTKYGDLRQYLSGFFDTTIGLVSLNFHSNFPLKSNNLFTPVAPVPMFFRGSFALSLGPKIL
jgi:hypothetical protein